MQADGEDALAGTATAEAPTTSTATEPTGQVAPDAQGTQGDPILELAHEETQEFIKDNPNVPVVNLEQGDLTGQQAPQKPVASEVIDDFARRDYLSVGEPCRYYSADPGHLGDEHAAIVVSDNDDGTHNLQVFARDSASTEFKPNVKFGMDPGCCR